MEKKVLDKIKEFPIITFLDSLGIAPAEQIGEEYYYLSPLRKENTPSFCVNERKNGWFDHGAGPDHKGGDIISLVQVLLNFDFKTAVQMLEQVVNNPALIGLDKKPKPVAMGERQYKQTLQISREVTHLCHPYLWNYLEKDRGLNIKLIKASAVTLSYLKEVYYTCAGRQKEYYAIGFKNSADAYELRSKNFQGFVGGKKTFTLIKGTYPGCAVFESFIDYLSALTYWQKVSLGYDIIILNSTRLVRQALPLLKSYPALHLYLDNDATGIKTADYIKEACRDVLIGNKEIEIKTHNHIYIGFKDINDFLTKTPPKTHLPGTSRDSNSKASQTAKWWLWVCWKEPKFTWDGKEFKHIPFYSLNNVDSGYQQLLQLRQEMESQIKYFRICERSEGREFKILEEGHV